MDTISRNAPPARRHDPTRSAEEEEAGIYGVDQPCRIGRSMQFLTYRRWVRETVKIEVISERSIIKVAEISEAGLIQAIRAGTLQSDIHYRVKGCVFLQGLSGSMLLPERLSITGSLYLQGCRDLADLPPFLSVAGSLFLSSLYKLTELPWTIEVKRRIYIKDCPGLISLPANHSRYGCLDLWGCQNLRYLPRKLEVERYLDLAYCENLDELPETMFVRGYLNLHGCHRLKCLPKDVRLGGDLCLTGCTRLGELPDWVTGLGRTWENKRRHVYLKNTQLPVLLMDNLRTKPLPGILFHVDLFRKRPASFATLDQAITFWWAVPAVAAPKLECRPDQAEDLVTFLERLTETVEYKDPETRYLLAVRVSEMFSLLNGDSEVSDNALTRIHQAISSCEDGVILALDDLETLHLSHLAETMALQNGDNIESRAELRAELRALGRQMMILDEVKKIASEHIGSSGRPASFMVEVELAFQIGLREYFDLPGSTRKMHYSYVADVSDQDIASAAELIEQTCTEQALDSYLETWDPWQKYRRNLAIPPFEQLQPMTVDRIKDCPFCLEKTGQMVVFGDDHFDYQSLRRAFLENSRDPFFKSPLDWSAVYRLEDEAPPRKKAKFQR